MPTDPMVGRTIAGYRLVQHVGEGGTATVYRAEHPERGAAAVKVLRPRLAQDPTAVKRFLREAAFGERVSHPHVVRTYDYGEAEGLHYLALEWAEGEPLDAFAAGAAPLPPPLAATIIEQVAGGLAAAHRAGIIHRDLKPANIMYDSARQYARLLDFGIARDAELSPEERLTRAGFFVGTLQYVAPETLSGELVTEQADIYSLATIAYYLLTATHPFRAANQRELFRQLLSERPVPLCQAVKGLRFPPALEAAVMHGLERDLGARARSVTEFAERFCAAARDTSSSRGGLLGSLFRLRGG